MVPPELLDRDLLATTVMAVAAFKAGMVGWARAQSVGDVPSLGGATTWLNSPPLTAAGLRGKVVLVDFFRRT